MVTNKIENEILTFFIEGNIDSTNSSEVEESIFPILESTPHSEVVVDFGKVSYVSSAGLRVFLRISKKEPKFKIINTSNEVFSVFEMTGFTTIMKIEKGLPKVSLENATLIGTGFCSNVYRLDRDTIVKVFTRTHDLDVVKKELDLAKRAFVLGVPTAISYGVVDVEGNLGLVFEMLNCSSLRDLVRDDVANRDKWIRKYAELIKVINNTDVADTVLPNMNEKMISWMELLKDGLSQEDYNFYLNLVKNVPPSSTFVHGDCHIKNILVNNGEFFVIDMETLSYGNPIFELSAICSTYLIFEETEPGNCQKFLNISAELSKDVFYKTLNYYFEGKPKEVIESNILKIRIMGYIFMMMWAKNANEPLSKMRYEYSAQKLKEMVPIIKDLNLE